MKKSSHFLIRVVVAILLLTLVLGMFSVALLPEAKAEGTRCPTSGTSKFLRFNYVPRPGAGYIENKSIIYVPKEAQCQGEFPLYIHLHGNNGRNDVSRYYLPRGTPGGQRSTEFGTPAGEIETTPQVGTGEFQSAMETAMRNVNIPGMIFVIPANNVYSVAWSGFDGQALKQAVQQALNSNPETSGLRITLGNDTIVSGHSGAGCRGASSGVLQATNMNPKAVGILDTCVSVYPEVTRRYANSTILLYAAGMAYTGATLSGTTESGGYHNQLQTLGFQAVTCDSNIVGAHAAGSALSADQRATSTHFKTYWENPQLPCAKHPDHNWYGVFATNTDHSAAVGKGMRTLLNITYSSSIAPTSGPSVPGGTVGTGGASGTSGPVGGTVSTATTFTGSGSIRLEAPIGDIGSIAGSGGGYIINYTRILFAFVGGIVGLLAMLMLIVAGIQMMGGSADQNKQAKERIIGALSGIAILAAGGWILYIINPCFFSFEDAQTCTRRIITQTNFQNVYGPDSAGPVAVGPGLTAPPPPRGTWIAPIYNSASVSESDRTRIRNAYMYNSASQFLPLPDPLPSNPVEAMMSVIESQLRVTGTFHPNFTTCNPISSEFMTTYCGMFCNLYVTWILKHSGLPYPRAPGNVSTLRSYILGKTMNPDETANNHFWYIPVAPNQAARSITQADIDRAPRPAYSPDTPQAGDIVFFICRNRGGTEAGTSSEAAGADCHVGIVVAGGPGNSFKWVDNNQGPAKTCNDFRNHCGTFDVMGFGRLRSSPQTTTDFSSRFGARGKVQQRRAGARVGHVSESVDFLLGQMGLSSDAAANQKLTEWATALVGTTGRGNRDHPRAPDTPENFFAGTSLANRLNEIFFERGTSPGTPPG